MDNDALGEMLRELMSEYSTSAGFVSWKQILFESLPYLVTIVTIITSTIVQLKASKRESERIVAQIKEQQNLERIRQEENRKTVILEKQLENTQKLQAARLSAYNDLMQAIYGLSNDAKSKVALTLIRAKTITLLGLCPPSEPVHHKIRALYGSIRLCLDCDCDISKNDIDSVVTYAEIIADFLIPPHSDSSTGNDNFAFGLQQKQH